MLAGITTLLLAIGLLSVPSPAHAFANPETVNLGSAGIYSILGGTGVTNSSGATTLSGDLGLSPSGAIAITGSLTVSGATHDKDAAAAQAQTDTLTAYNNAAGRTADSVFAGDNNGRTYTAGVYYSGGAFALTGTMTLDGGGNPDAVFIFNVDAALNTAAASTVSLINGAQPGNVFWRVLGAAGTGASSNFSGTILAAGAVTLGAGSSLNGRALSTGAVTLASNTITTPTPVTTSAPTVPGAPTSVSAVAGDTQATVSWTAPASNGGSAITGYTVTSSGRQSATTTGATTATLTGLTNGTAYTFTVTATNAIGTSTASTATTPVFFPIPLPPVGRATASLDGEAIPVTFTENRPNDTVTLTGSDAQVILGPQSNAEAKQALGSDGTPNLISGGVFELIGHGFVPDTTVDFYLISSSVATFLQSLDVSGDGSYTGSVRIPSDLAHGTYTLQLNGLVNDTRQGAAVARVLSISILVRVNKPAAKKKTVQTIVHFQGTSTKLTEPAKRQLDALVDRVPTGSNNLINLDGFVAPVGSSRKAVALSKARTQSVARYLRSKGVSGKYILKPNRNDLQVLSDYILVKISVPAKKPARKPAVEPHKQAGRQAGDYPFQRLLRHADEVREARPWCATSGQKVSVESTFSRQAATLRVALRRRNARK